MVPTHHFAIDGVSEELLAAGDDGACQAERGGRLVEELEGPVVDVGLVKLEVVGEVAEKVRHGDLFRPLAASQPARRSTLTSSQLGSNRLPSSRQKA